MLSFDCPETEKVSGDLTIALQKLPFNGSNQHRAKSAHKMN
jgi:hypothetical protein